MLVNVTKSTLFKGTYELQICIWYISLQNIKKWSKYMFWLFINNYIRSKSTGTISPFPATAFFSASSFSILLSRDCFSLFALLSSSMAARRCLFKYKISAYTKKTHPKLQKHFYITHKCHYAGHARELQGSKKANKNEGRKKGKM